jgi:hypothetical protein
MEIHYVWEEFQICFYSFAFLLSTKKNIALILWWGTSGSSFRQFRPIHPELYFMAFKVIKSYFFVVASRQVYLVNLTNVLHNYGKDSYNSTPLKTISL